uniref:DUF4283 domain-containing protein n=1 Tax=Cannabis sativa TaxID=3483 RepID=A0A803PZ54_CANSA
MDDLASFLSISLNLTDTKSTVNSFQGSSSQTNPNLPAPNIFIIAKLHSNKSYSKKHFRETMTKDWNKLCHFLVVITKRPPNLLLVAFGCDGDRRRIMIQQPWIYQNNAILIDIPNSLDVLNGNSLHSIPLWVQVHNTPFFKRSEELVALISLRLRPMLEVDKLSFKETWGSYLRIKIMFNVSQPIHQGIPIEFQSINKVVWLTLKHENLPNICFFCGRMGHSYNDGYFNYLKTCDESPTPPYLCYEKTSRVKF